jgi:SAM-dependent methyltransferase
MNPADAWEHFGRKEPYYGVLTDPRFATVTPGEPEWHTFFETGESDVARAFAIIRQELRPDFKPVRALDFGCGVGRVLLPLAGHCAHAIGLDVSQAMLAEARLNAGRRGIGNVTFQSVAGAVLPDTGTYDFLHSYIVFQHIPVRPGLALLEHLVTRLEAGGIGAVHLLFDQTGPERWRRFRDQHLPLWHRYNKWRQKLPMDRPAMQMNGYPMRQVLDILRDHDCHRLHLRFTDHAGHRGGMLFFAKEPQAII